MRNSSQIAKTGSLAALVVGLGLLAASAPAFADGNGSSGEGPFPTTGVVRLGLSPAAPAIEVFTAYYPGGSGPAHSCAPVITRHQNTDTIDYPAPGSC